MPDPQPETGQVLVEVRACGICGSDLHFAAHGGTMLELGAQITGVPDLGRTPPSLDNDIFMGHEFSAEVLEVGPDTVAPAPGSLVTSIPVMVTATGIQDLAYSDTLPAGYSERMLLSAPLLLEVPNGLDARRAALTEPMAVGLHAVNKSGIQQGQGALVLGCGPVGLAVIAALSLRGRGADRGVRLLARPPSPGGGDGCPRGRRRRRRFGVRGVDGEGAGAHRRRLRGHRRPRHHQRHPAARRRSVPGR